MKKQQTEKPFTDAWNEPFDKATQARMKKEFAQEQKKAAAARAKKLKETKERTFLLQVTVPVNDIEKFLRSVLPAAALKKIEPKLAGLKETIVFDMPAFTHVNLADTLADDKMLAKVKKMMAQMWTEHFAKNFAADKERPTRKKWFTMCSCSIHCRPAPVNSYTFKRTWPGQPATSPGDLNLSMRIF